MLPVKPATARFFADCLRSDRPKDRQRILRELEPAFITVTKTRRRRSSLNSASSWPPSYWTTCSSHSPLSVMIGELPKSKRANAGLCFWGASTQA